MENFLDEYWSYYYRYYRYLNREYLRCECESCSTYFLRISELLCNHLVCDACRRQTLCPICVYDVSKVKPTRLLINVSNELTTSGNEYPIISAINHITDRRIATKHEITDIFAKLRSKLENRNKDLLKELNNIYYLKLQSFNDDEIFFIQIRKTFIILNNLLKKRNDPLTILKIHLKTIITFDKLKKRPSPREDGRINFNSCLFSLAKSNIENLGFVFGDAVPEKTLVSGFGTEFVLVGMETYLTVTCFDYFERQCLYGGEQIRATLIYQNHEIELEVKDLKAGLYKVIIKTDLNKGIIKTDRKDPLPTLNITLKGFRIQKNLKISGFKFPPNFQFLSIQRKNIHRIICGTGQISFSKKCWGLCCSNDGDIYVADKEYNCIFVFNHRFEFVGKFGIPGKGDGEFNRPTGMCIDDSEILYVVDKDNHRVQLFTKDGRFIHKFGTRGSEAGKFEFPWSVATSPSYIVVSDSNNHRLQLFNKNLEFLALHDTLSQFTPRDLHFVDDEFLMVSDFHSNFVYQFKIIVSRKRETRHFISKTKFELFDHNHKFLFEKPQGIFHYENTLFVAETKHGNLHVFQKYQNNHTHSSNNHNQIHHQRNIQRGYTSNNLVQLYNGIRSYDPNIPDKILYKRMTILNIVPALLKELKLVGFNPCNITMTPDGKLLVLHSKTENPGSNLHSKNENPGSNSNEIGSYLVCLDLYEKED